MDDVPPPASTTFQRRVGAWVLASVGAALAARLTVNGRVATHYFYASDRSFAIGILGAAMLVVAWLLVIPSGRQRRVPLALLVLALVMAVAVLPHTGPLVQPVTGAPRFGWMAFLVSTLPMVLAVVGWMVARGRPRSSRIAAAATVFVAAWFIPYITLWPDQSYRLRGVGTPVAVACVIAAWVGRAVEVRGRQIAGGTIIGGAIGWRAITTVAAVAGIVLMGASYAYGRSDTFKAECTVHKLTGVSISWFKNTICDTNFTIKTGS